MKIQKLPNGSRRYIRESFSEYFLFPVHRNFEHMELPKGYYLCETDYQTGHFWYAHWIAYPFIKAARLFWVAYFFIPFTLLMLTRKHKSLFGLVLHKDERDAMPLMWWREIKIARYYHGKKDKSKN